MAYNLREGIYLARMKSHKWWHLIANVEGKAPFLRVKCWDLISDELIKITDPEKLIFGPELDLEVK